MPWIVSVSQLAEELVFHDKANHETRNCEYAAMESNNNGTYSKRVCSNPKLRVSIGSKTWVSDYCASHSRGNEACEEDFAKAGFGTLENNLGDLLKENFEKYLKGDHHFFGPTFGTHKNPIRDLALPKIELKDMEEDEIYIQDCSVNGPIFIKNSKFGTLNINLKAGSILTISDSQIDRIVWESEDLTPLKLWIGGSSISDIAIRQQSISEIGADKSIVGNITLNRKTSVAGIITLSRSTCNFQSGDFSNASVSVARSISFSDSLVNGCQFSPWTVDEWRKLLRNYGNNSALFAILLFMAFALPLISEYFLWNTVSDFQNLLSAILPAASIGSENFSKCLSERCQDVSLLLIILGYNKGISYMAITISLLLLNIFRLIMVREVSIIKESADISGRYPIRGKIFPEIRLTSGPGGSMFDAWRYSYRHLSCLHIALQILLAVSFFSFCITIYGVATKLVAVPLV